MGVILNSKIIEKIQKLLSLSESTNENEAKIAMLKAQELLIKYKISMFEVEDFKANESINKSKIEDKRTNVSFTKAKWKASLAITIANNFKCYNYLKTRSIHTIVFFGRKEDVIICNIVLEYAINCIENGIYDIRKEYGKLNRSIIGVSNDYAMGFVAGLSKRFEEQKEANKEWGLILVKDKEVIESYNKKVWQGHLDTSSEFRGNGDSYRKGEKDGKEFNISDKIAKDGSETLELV